jgi:ABC-type bacteriocin/lantibiotic exporter with double-glycine peptidase domain
MKEVVSLKKPSEYVELLRSLKKEWKWLLKYASRYRLQIVFYVIAGLVSTAMGLGSSVASKYLIDSVVSHDNGSILRSAFLAVGLGIAQIAVSAIVSRIAGVVGTKISTEIKGGVYEHMLCSKWESIRKYH